MTTRTPLVVVNGQTQQMPTGDAVPLTHGGTGATTAGDALTALGAVPSARTLTMTAPLTGGGNLSADRTLGLSYDSTLTVTSGVLGVSSLVALAAHTHSAYLTGNQAVTLSGDATGTGTTAITLTLASVATAGTYRSVTVNAKGLVTAGTNPTTLAGYGITDGVTASGSVAYATNAGNSATTSQTTFGSLNVGSAIGATAGGIFARAVANDSGYYFLPANGAIIGSFAAIAWPGVGSLAVAGGINVGSATGAGTGQIAASGNLTAGTSSVNIGMHPTYTSTYGAVWRGTDDYALLFETNNTYVNSRSGTIYFRDNNTNRGYIDSTGLTVVGDLTIAGNTALHAGNYSSYAATAAHTHSQYSINTSAARPGPYRMYRRDYDTNYSVQTYWTGTYWNLSGYNSDDTYHAGCTVAYADNAGYSASTAAHTHTDFGWYSPALSGWGNYGGEWAAWGYCKDKNGMVHLRGLIASYGSGSQIITQLPPGYCPSGGSEIFIVSSSAGHHRVDVHGDGSIEIRDTWATVAYLSLSGITFSAVV